MFGGYTTPSLEAPPLESQPESPARTSLAVGFSVDVGGIGIGWLEF